MLAIALDTCVREMDCVAFNGSLNFTDVELDPDAPLADS
jgi:hypothetical protein